jgi:DNA-directed RNA polymerase beta subunit
MKRDVPWKDAEVPDNVELYDPDDFQQLRTSMFDKTRDAFASQFPQTYNGVTLEVKDLDYVDPENLKRSDQRNGMLQDKYLSRRLRGTVVLKDEITGEVLDQKKMSLMRVPYVTDHRGTIVHGGNDYKSIMQARLLPGAYTRRQDNGGLETQVNPRVGSGKGFRIALEPDTGLYRFRIGASQTSLYSLLHDMGVSDEELSRRWGPKLLEVNKAKYDSKALDRAYNKMVPKRYQVQDASREEKAKALRDALESAQVHEDVLRTTLPMARLSRVKAAASVGSTYLVEDGEPYVHFGLDGVLSSTDKLLAVNRQEEDADDRDDWAFKKVMRTPDMVSERVIRDAGGIRGNMMRRLAKTKNLSGVHAFYFDPYVEGQLVGNPLSSPLEEINPMHLMDQARRVTLMGPGGIGSPDAITEEAQSINPSTFGFLSVIEGPESERAGIDTRLADGVKIGSDGRLYRPFYDKTAGKYRYLNPAQVQGRPFAIRPLKLT